MFYNQQTATTTQTCLMESTAGNFCAEWEVVEIKTLNWFDTFALLGIPLTVWLVFKAFKKK